MKTLVCLITALFVLHLSTSSYSQGLTTEDLIIGIEGEEIRDSRRALQVAIRNGFYPVVQLGLPLTLTPLGYLVGLINPPAQMLGASVGFTAGFFGGYFVGSMFAVDFSRYVLKRLSDERVLRIEARRLSIPNSLEEAEKKIAAIEEQTSQLKSKLDQGLASSWLVLPPEEELKEIERGLRSIRHFVIQNRTQNADLDFYRIALWANNFRYDLIELHQKFHAAERKSCPERLRALNPLAQDSTERSESPQ